jgi:hypothetical protein
VPAREKYQVSKARPNAFTKQTTNVESRTNQEESENNICTLEGIKKPPTTFEGLVRALVLRSNAHKHVQIKKET